MQTTAIDFLLAPDGASARRLRKLLARQAPGLFRMAGTWPELMAQAEAAYLLPPHPGDWSAGLQRAAIELEDGFWASSLSVAPRETMAQLDAAACRLLEAAGPEGRWQSLLDGIPGKSRLHRRLSDLSGLLKSADQLPVHLQKMAGLLAVDHAPLRTIRVYHLQDSNDLNAWQAAVLKKLATDAPSSDVRLQAIVEKALSLPATTSPALGALRDLYADHVTPPRKIDGVRVIAVRDSLAEAEIAAGLIQEALGQGLPMSDIGLLLPEDPLNLMAVEDVFARCGLPLSGFRRPMGQRDLGRETMRTFLQCLRKPAPMMAIAALLTSPLMPWSAKEGHAMAQAVMGGDVMLKSSRVPAAGGKLMALLDQGASSPEGLRKQLKRFLVLVSLDKAGYDHWQRAHETADLLQGALSGAIDLEWEKLLYLAAPEQMRAMHPVDYWHEGLPVFHEDVLPWCCVRHLFVLGFNDGHFPAGTGTSAVLNEAEWEAIARAGWPVQTGDCLRRRRRQLFARQLGVATERLTLLYACRDAGGRTLEPSASLVFLARSLGIESEDLVLNLDRPQDARQIPDLPLAPAAAPRASRELIVSDIELGVDLLEAFGRKRGGLAPLSPSAADTLMVSPLAWLLGRLGCDPREWGPDNFDVLKAGTLAHRVFEALFEAGRPLPSEEEITQRMPRIVQAWVLQVAPFLRSPDWRVELLKFESEMLRAAVHWKKLLASCNGRVVAAEQWLRGQHGDVPLHGQSDLLVKLASGRLLVVDYKKSSSGKRRERMRSGFDLQAHLYRLMIRTGGLPEVEAPPDDIGIVYYLLNDTTALSDGPVGADGSVPGWEVLANDISSRAMQHLDQRLAQIRKGTVRLNNVEDEGWWKKNASLPIYSLDNSPLLRLFMHAGEVTS